MQRTIVSALRRDEVTFVRTCEETDGKITVLDVKLMPGGGVPAHYHHTYSETFTAVEGALGIKLNGETVLLQPGESATAPPHALHAFFNPGTAPIRFRTDVEPGHSGFENSLRIAYGMEADGLCNQKGIPKKLSHLAVAAMQSESHMPGMIAVIMPLLRWVYRRAQRNGTEEELLRRYCN